MPYSIIETQKTDGYECFRIPGIVYTADGSILLYYEARKTVSDWAQIDIGMRKSTDGGASWSDRRILVYGNGKTVNNPVMFADDGNVTLVYQEAYARTFMMRSPDGGDTWTEPKELTDMLKTPLYEYTVIACGPGHGTVLSGGRYIVPVWMALNREHPKAHHPSVITTIYSDDRGETWKMGEVCKGELMDPSETALAEAHGEILINIRNENPVQKRALMVSRDGASGWRDFRFCDALTDPTCAAGMISIENDIYFTNCRDAKERRNLTLSKSSDLGKTWMDIAQIADIAGYSDIAADAQGNILVFYEHWAADEKQLRFAKIHLPSQHPLGVRKLI